MNHRRTFIRQTAAAASALAFPLVGGAQPKAVKVGILQKGQTLSAQELPPEADAISSSSVIEN